MSFLRVDRLHINLGEFYLKGVCLEVDRGDYVAIVGPTGAGKTILLESIIGFWIPDQGNIYLEDRNITHALPEKRHIGIVYQDYALLPHFTVYKNIEYGLKKIDPKGMKAKIHTMAAALHIDHLFHRKPATLSGGEQQRVALARALVVEPKMLLMDEPFSALDPQTRQETRALLKKVITEQRTTILHVTHDLADAWSLANKVAVIRNGTLLQYGALNNVFRRPNSPFIANFVGATLLDGTVVGHDDGMAVVNVNGFTLRTIDTADIGRSVQLAIRPEDIIVATRPLSNTSVQNHIRATLAEIVYEGKTSLLNLNAGDTFFDVLVTNHSLERLALSPGDTVYAMIKSAKVHIVPAHTDIR